MPPASISPRFLRLLRPALACLAVVFSSATLAFGSVDPFNTESLSPPSPRLSLPEDGDFIPCQTPSQNLVYGVIEVVDQALCRNPKTHEAWASARIQAAQVGLAQSDYLPDLDGKASTSQTRTDDEKIKQRSGSLTLSWLLYDSGARSANLDNARQLLSAASSTLDATVQNVFLSALQSYYNAQAARAAVTAAFESEKASRESMTAADTRYRVGTGTPADRLQAQTALSQTTLNRIKAEGILKNTLGTLANVMGMSASQPLRLDEIPSAKPEASFERDIEILIDDARQSRPDLKAAEAQLKAAQSGVDFARSSGLPTLSLSAGPGWQNTRTDNSDISFHDQAIGLTLTLPIFSGFETSYRVRSAQARAELASAQRDTLRLQVALDVWTAYQSLTTATQTLKTTADLLASAEQSERVALGRYKAGVGNILDTLNAQSALAAARLQRIQSALDWHVSRASLARAVGLLDGRLLNPAVLSTRP